MPEYNPAQPITSVGGTGKSDASSGLYASPALPAGTGTSALSGTPEDTADLSAQAQAQLAQLQQEEGTKLTPEEEAKQQELMQKIQELVAKLNGLLAQGKMDEANSVMQEIASLTGGSQMSLPDVAGTAAEAGNIPGSYGDAPAFYTQPGGTGGYNAGGSGVSSPVDLSGVRQSLPGDGNQGVVNTALDIASQGLPYVWGGDGPQEGGYDCSGFSKAVYAKNGINIPRTAQTQFDYCKKQGTLFTDEKSAKPGDLIFFNNPYDKKTTPVGHVMVYLGNGKMAGAQSGGVKVYDVKSMQKYIVGYGRPHN